MPCSSSGHELLRIPALVHFWRKLPTTSRHVLTNFEGWGQLFKFLQVFYEKKLACLLRKAISLKPKSRACAICAISDLPGELRRDLATEIIVEMADVESKLQGNAVAGKYDGLGERRKLGAARG